MPPHVYVVMPVFNRREVTLACLRDLSAQSYAPITTIVVDDGSIDGTAEAVRGAFPSVVLLKGDGNLWWSGATNLGVKFALERAAEGDYLLTLNNDTRLGTTYVESLVDAAGKKSGALIGSVALRDDDPETVLDGGNSLSWWTAKQTAHGRGKRLDVARRTAGPFLEVDVLPGRGTLVPVTAYRRCGLYAQELLPQYAADYEFSARAHRSGFPLFVAYDVTLTSATSLTGANNLAVALPWSKFLQSFFSRRSPYHLVTRFNFARLAVPRMSRLPFFLCDVTRLVIGRTRAQFRRSTRAMKV
jgi:GT2 family glycosyltransferase